jgi:hypothetical protein
VEEIKNHKKNKFQSNPTLKNFEDPKQQWITRVNQMGLGNKDSKNKHGFCN